MQTRTTMQNENKTYLVRTNAFDLHHGGGVLVLLLAPAHPAAVLGRPTPTTAVEAEVGQGGAVAGFADAARDAQVCQLSIIRCSSVCCEKIKYKTSSSLLFRKIKKT